MQNLTAPDQLRQRVAFALSQIFVIGGNKMTDATGYTNYLQLLENDSFTNYRQIMQDVTLSPAMGHWLDMVNNGKPNVSKGDHANENYAREFMQLFTIGTSQLNPDGSFQLDSQRQPDPHVHARYRRGICPRLYGLDVSAGAGRDATNLQSAILDGSDGGGGFQSRHRRQAIADLSRSVGRRNAPRWTISRAGSARSDGQCIQPSECWAFHFEELIQHLVTSNPSPAYIQRVASVFNNNGSGVRGDMKSVITAILMDPEARRGDDPATAVGTDGHLQEPILYMTGLLRAFGATSDGSNLAYYGNGMGQEALVRAKRIQFLFAEFRDSGDDDIWAGISNIDNGHVAESRELGEQFCVRLAGVRNYGEFFQLRDAGG